MPLLHWLVSVAVALGQVSAACAPGDAGACAGQSAAVASPVAATSPPSVPASSATTLSGPAHSVPQASVPAGTPLSSSASVALTTPARAAPASSSASAAAAGSASSASTASKPAGAASPAPPASSGAAPAGPSASSAAGVGLSSAAAVAASASTAATATPSKAATASSAWPTALLFSPLVASKILAAAQANHAPPSYPVITDSTVGAWQLGAPNSWTTGFFPATLYQMAKRECLCPGSTAASAAGTPPNWLALGRTWSAAIVPLHWNNSQGHDVGFLSFPFAEEISLNPTNSSAQNNLIEFALELSSRFDTAVGCTRSWDGSAPNSTSATDFLVIIDNMMNLESLLQSFRLTGNATFTAVATRHADMTLANHVRADWGTYHVVNYNSQTGAVKSKYTAQGFSDNSTWTRGEAWAIQGYTKMFQYTQQVKYLNAARNFAALFLRRTPAAYLPWDFDAPASPAPPADSSAAMIASTGLLLLAAAESAQNNATGAARWTSGAQMLISQTAGYAWRPSWASVLANGTRDNHGVPHSNDTGLVYDDYYWVKAGNYLLGSGALACPNGAPAASAASCGLDLNGPAF